MYTLLIQAYANARETSGVAEVLAEFLAQERRGLISDGRHAEQNERDALAAERTVIGLFAEVVQAYIGAGDSEAAMALLTQVAEQQNAGAQSEAGSLPPFTKVLITRAVFAMVAAGDSSSAVQLTQELASGQGLFATALSDDERTRAVAQCTQYLLNDALATGNVEVLEKAVALLPRQTENEDVDAFVILNGETAALSATIARTLLLLATCTQSYPVATALGLLHAFDTPEVRQSSQMEIYGPAPLSALVQACAEANAPQDIIYVLSFFDQPSRARNTTPLAVEAVREARSQVFASVKDYDEAVEITAMFERYGCLPSTKDALGLVRQYVSSGTASTWTPERIAMSIKIFEVPAAAVEAETLQGEDAREYDGALERFVADLASAHVAISTPQLERLMNALALRKGHEQAESILVNAFGKATMAPLLSSAAAPTGSPILSEPGSETFAAPSETSTAPTSVAPTYRLDRKLSSIVDSHFGAKATSTPLAAYSALKQGLDKGVVPDPFVIGRLLQALARMGEEAKVRELYSLAHEIIVTLLPAERQLPAWIQVEDLMLIAACHLGHLEQAGMHRARIIEQGVAPSADAYATMISSTKDTTDDASVARELWDESQRYGVKPHLYLYNTIISKLSKARKAETALEFFQKMKAEGLRPSSVTYGAVIVSRAHHTIAIHLADFCFSERVRTCRRRRVCDDIVPGDAKHAKL
jgi:pentatricopeptide repeat protein